MTKVNDVIEITEDILEDSAIPRNIKLKLEEIVGVLKKSTDDNLKLTVDKCVHELENISNDVNIQAFVRTQIWSLISMLESIE